MKADRVSPSRGIQTKIFFWMVLFLSPLLWRTGALAEETSSASSSPTGVTRLKIVEEAPPRFEIVINIPATELVVFDRGRPVRRYKIAVGMPRWPTPEGRFEITEIQWNPWWYPPPSDWAKDAKPTPPGPANPLGPVKLMMSEAIRIHGTMSPGSIGRAASHGCMRMFSRDAKDLARFLQSEIFGDTDPKIYENYQKVAWKTFSKVLPNDNPVWVYLTYNPIERRGNGLVIHPNYYGRSVSVAQSVMDLLAEMGVYTAPLDVGKLHEMQKKYRSAPWIPFRDLLVEGVLPEEWGNPFVSYCEAKNSAPPLDALRDRFNRRLRRAEEPLVMGRDAEPAAW